MLGCLSRCQHGSGPFLIRRQWTAVSNKSYLHFVDFSSLVFCQFKNYNWRGQDALVSLSSPRGPGPPFLSLLPLSLLPSPPCSSLWLTEFPNSCKQSCFSSLQHSRTIPVTLSLNTDDCWTCWTHWPSVSWVVSVGWSVGAAHGAVGRAVWTLPPCLCPSCLSPFSPASER